MKYKYFYSISIILTIAFFGFWTITHQAEGAISVLEKRELRYVTALTGESWMTEQFQTSVGEALEDNILLRNWFLTSRNKFDFLLKNMDSKIIELFLDDNQNKYTVIPINNSISLSEDFDILMRDPQVYDETVITCMEGNIDKINHLSEKYSDVDFYVYLPLLIHESKYFDINNVTNDHLNLFNNLTVPWSTLEFDNIQSLLENYYKTDHHWNHRGAYKGYQDIMRLMYGSNFKTKVPIDEVVFEDIDFYGSHSRAIAHSIDIHDNIGKYIYNIELGDYYVNGSKLNEYGTLSNYRIGQFDKTKGFNHYGTLYQTRVAEIVFNNKDENQDNILVISDSYSNVIRDVIASHFNKSTFINLDMYIKKHGEFNIEHVIESSEIDKVLFMNVLGNYTPEGEMKHLIINK